MKQSIINIVSVIGIVVVVSALGWVLVEGVDRQEEVECNELQSQSMKYELFFASEWQKDMCRAHGFDVSNW